MQSLGALIAAARRRTSQVVLERVTEHQISAQQFWILVSVQETPGVSQVEIAEHTLSDTASVSRALSSLTDRGLVENAPNPAIGAGPASGSPPPASGWPRGWRPWPGSCGRPW